MRDLADSLRQASGLLENGELAESESILARVAHEFPDSPDVFFLLGVVLHGHSEGAAPAWRFLREGRRPAHERQGHAGQQGEFHEISAKHLATSSQLTPLIREKITRPDDFVKFGVLTSAATKLIGEDLIAFLAGNRALSIAPPAEGPGAPRGKAVTVSSGR